MTERPDKPTGTSTTQRRTFLLLISMFLHVQVVLIVLAAGSLILTNQMRAYTLGEGLYAKAQKQAIIALQRYASSYDPAHYAEFREKIAVTTGDRDARETLDSENPDTRVAREGFLQGRNHPDDISGMVTVFVLFRNTSLFRPAIDLWEQADGVVARMVERADELHAEIASGEITPERRNALLNDIHTLDREITALQDEFSSLLGDISRRIKNYAIVLLAVTSMLLWGACLVFGLRLHRRSVDAERQLIQREKRLRMIMDNTADGIVSILPDGRIDSANRATAQMLGYDMHALRGRAAETIVAEADRDAFAIARGAAQRDKDLTDGGNEIAVDGLRNDGSTFPLEIVFTRDDSAGKGSLVGVLRDITQRVSTEVRLFQAQKMEAVGQLTGGVAHDFNNLLTVITGNLELLREDLHDPDSRDEAERQIDAALRAAERGARVTSHLLAFSRRQPLAPKDVDVDRLIRDMRELFEQTVSGAITLRYELESFGWRALVDRVQLEGALLNLVLNARHATRDGGMICIASRHVAPDDPALERLDLDDGEYIRIAVTDNGSGIDPANIDKVFEPFFTTKDVGAGTGLGLSMVHGFVRQSGGEVRIESQPGEGTTVELFLPRADASSGAATTVRRKIYAPGGQRILVVEDHPALCLLAVRMLESQGYEAEGVADAVAGLKRIEEGPLPDLLLSDIVLPEGMDGFELVSRVRDRYPGIAVLLMSGFPRDALKDRDGTGIALLSKPFTREELLEAVGSALSRQDVSA